MTTCLVGADRKLSHSDSDRRGHSRHQYDFTVRYIASAKDAASIFSGTLAKDY